MRLQGTALWALGQDRTSLKLRLLIYKMGYVVTFDHFVIIMRSQVLHAPGSVLSRDERPLMVKRTSGFRDLSFFEKWFLFCFVSCLLLLFLFHGFIGALQWHAMLVFIVTHSHMHSTTVYLTNVITHYFPFCSLPPFLGPFPVLYSAALDVQEIPPKTFLPIFLSDFHIGGFFFFFLCKSDIS